MRNWLADLLSGRPRRRAPAAPAPHPASPAPSATLAPGPATGAAVAAPAPSVAQFPVPATPADLAAPFVEWQQDSAPSRETPLGPRELRALRHLDELLADHKPAADLLPRTPAVVPQLLNLLRQDTLPLAAVTDRVSKDIPLTAEVLRLANSAHYRQRSLQPVSDLSHAIQSLGSDGVQRAIARVVLKPLFDAPAGVLASTAAPRLWEHGERKAVMAATLAGQRGLEPFDGYLAGLMHNAGWTIAWRAFDRMDGGVSAPFSESFVHQLVQRKDRLFGKAATAWQISAALSALGAEVQAHGLEPAQSPLAAVLAAADREATLAVLAPTIDDAVTQGRLLQPAA